MRFRIIELLVVFSVSGFASLSLKQSDPPFETMFFSFTLAFILASILLAVGTKEGARAYWAGFAISSICYLVLAHVPDTDGIVPRHNGPEVTTQWLRHLFHWMHDDPSGSSTPRPGGYFSLNDDLSAFGEDGDARLEPVDNEDTPKHASEPFPSNISLVFSGGQQIVADGRSIAFMRIGHAAWALFLGWIGGHFTQLIFKRSRRDETSR